ncbi:MAG: LamG domain-containing protein [Planctomycetota bacterium]
MGSRCDHYPERRWLAAILLWAVSWLLCSTVLAGKSKSAVPEPEQFREANLLVRDVYQKELSGARRPTEKVALASKLVATVKQGKEQPASNYAMLLLARLLGMEANDLDTSFDAIDVLEEQFEIDPWPQREETAKAIHGKLRTGPDRRRFAERLEPYVSRLAGTDRWDLTLKLADLYAQSARLSGDAAIAKRGASFHETLTAWRQQAVGFEEARAALVADADNAAAHQTVGRFLCFCRADWAQGLSHLAKGSDPALRELAEADRGDATTAEQMAGLADRWWTYADSSQKLDQDAARIRAGFWYEEALPQLAGLQQTRAKQRLGEVARLPLKGILARMTAPPPPELLEGLIVLFTFNAEPKRDRDRTVFAADVGQRGKGSALDGGVVGATWTSGGRAGGGLEFSTTADPKASDKEQGRIGLGQDIAGYPLGDFTIAVWAAVEGNGALFGTGQKELWPKEWYLTRGIFHWQSVEGKSSGAKGSVHHSLKFSAPALKSGWHHYCVTRQGQTVTVFVDGVARGQSASFPDAPLPIYENGLYLGNQLANSSRYVSWKPFAGSLDEFGIWNRALPAEQIGQLVELGRGRRSLK